jgi:hypothetical protein
MRVRRVDRKLGSGPAVVRMGGCARARRDIRGRRLRPVRGRVRALRQRLRPSISILGSGPILLASHLRCITRNIEVRIGELSSDTLLVKSSLHWLPREDLKRYCLLSCLYLLQAVRHVCHRRGAMTRSWCVHLRNQHSHWRKRNPLSKCPLRCHERVSSAFVNRSDDSDIQPNERPP